MRTNFYAARRFFVLEDEAGDYREIVEFLKRLTRDFYGHHKLRLPPSFEVIWSHYQPPLVTNNTTFFAAPLRFARECVERRTYTFDGNTWNEEQVDRNVGLVPWLIDEKEHPDLVLPHACILDVLTGPTPDSANANTCNFIRSKLQNCGYPSSLVWVLSSQPIQNSRYGMFVPKQELSKVTGDEVPKGPLSVLANQLSYHGRGTTDHPRNGVVYKRSYLERSASEFSKNFIERRTWSWRPTIRVDDGFGDADVEKYHRWLYEDGEQPDSRIEISFARTLLRASHFTFFTGPLDAEAQGEYLQLKHFGLPVVPFALNESGELRDISEVLLGLAITAKDETFNAILRINCFVALELLVGLSAMGSFNRAWPALELGAANFSGLFKLLLKSIDPQILIMSNKDERGNTQSGAPCTFKKWFASTAAKQGKHWPVKVDGA